MAAGVCRGGVVSRVAALNPRSAAVEPVWLSPVQVCERVPGMTVGRLQNMRKEGRGPSFFKPTLKTVIYAQSDVDAWVRSTRVPTRVLS